MNFNWLRQTILTPVQWCAILIGLFAPISVALDNVMLALILLGAVFSLGSITRNAVSHPIAQAAILFFSVLFIAMFYGSTPLKEAFIILMKYIDLMFIPIFIYFFSTDAVQRKARYAFLVAMAITLIISYLIGLNILAVTHWMNPWTEANNPAIFHSHITQNNMMAFAVFLALLECRNATSRGKKAAWTAFSVLGIINIMFMVQGRTGYLILFALLSWFTWTTFAHALRSRNKSFGWLQKGAILLALLAGAIAAYQASPQLHNRVALAVTEYQAWAPDKDKTSIGQRLNFYSHSFQIVKKSPLLGVGTGGFPAAYEAQSNDTVKTRNPHNEYLMVSVQTGVVGLALMLYLFFTLWHFAPSLPTSLEQDAARGLVLAYLLNCTLNSALLDHSDGLFFAFMTGLLFANLKPKHNV